MMTSFFRRAVSPIDCAQSNISISEGSRGLRITCVQECQHSKDCYSVRRQR